LEPWLLCPASWTLYRLLPETAWSCARRQQLTAPFFQPYSLHLQIQKPRLLFNPLMKDRVVRAFWGVVVYFGLISALPKFNFLSFSHDHRTHHVIVTLVSTSHLEFTTAERSKTNPRAIEQLIKMVSPTTFPMDIFNH
jgi:hypothetical protein